MGQLLSGPYRRRRYQEWRRDVRWAMYNKRVRIATEMFSELFGPDFDSIIPIYPTGKHCRCPCRSRARHAPAVPTPGPPVACGARRPTSTRTHCAYFCYIATLACHACRKVISELNRNSLPATLSRP